MTAQQGNRAKNYQVAFTEPFLFDRPMTAGVDLFAREIRYEGQFTQESVGGNVVFGFQVMPYARMFVNYSLEQVEVKDLNPLYRDPLVLAGNPFLADSLLIGEGGKRTISKIGPSYVYNTVDHPIFPTSGSRYTLSLDWAGLGGNTNFVNPRAEAIWYFPIGAKRRTSLGFRAQAEYIKPYGSTIALPIFEKLFLGGEYSMRGFDLRTVGPRDPVTGLVLGGNKSLLFNAEYLITSRVRCGWCSSTTPARCGLEASPSLEGTGHPADVPGRAHPDPWRLLSDPVQSVRVAVPAGDQRDRGDERVQDVDRRRDPLLHAGAERAVPADFRDEPVARRRAGQQPAAGEEVEVPVRGGVDVLRQLSALSSQLCSGAEIHERLLLSQMA